jgi:hypothetical protein
MKTKRIFWNAFWDGVAAPGLLFAYDSIKIRRVSKPLPDVLSAMRGDWERVGQDFWRVIEREKAAATK